jgi:2,3-bisphosphoglycerate-dependent phosphoglycerate mutase
MLQRSFYFLRHGETDWNKDGKIQGHTDIPLNETGRSQAEQVVSILTRAPIHRIVVSNLSRAYETASIINAALQKPLVVDDGLKERSFGDFEGLAIEEMDSLREGMLKKGLPAEENGYPCPPKGEPYADFRVRTIAAFGRNLKQFEGENILFVAHGGVYRVLRRCLFTDLDHSGNVQPFHFEKRPGDWALNRLK